MKKHTFLLITLLITIRLLSQNSSFTVYNTSNSPIPGNAVRSIAIDNQGTIWIVTDGGTASMNNDNWTLFDLSEIGINSNSITNVYIGKNEDIWLGTWGEGVAKYDGVSWIHYDSSNSGLLDNYITGFAIEPDGTSWISNFAGVQSFDGIAWTIYNSSNSPIPDYTNYKSITVDDSGGVWVGGRFLFDGNNWTTFDSPYASGYGYITSIDFETNGTVWEGSEDESWYPGPTGLQSFDGLTWTTFNTWDSGLPNDQVTSLVIDSSDNKWIGTWNGIAKFENNIWTVFNTTNSNLESNFINSIAMDSIELMWFATDNGLALLNTENTNSENISCSNSCLNVTVYPCPASDWLYVDILEYFPETKIYLIDLLGQIVFTGKLQSPVLQIDISFLKSGNYILKILNNDTSIVKKIVVE